jgi:hypothetical protein
MQAKFNPMASPAGKPAHPVNANVHPVETNLLKLIALQNGLKLNSGKGIVKVKEILFNSLLLN